MIPSVGRIVLYTNLGDADGKYPPEQQAAIVTKVRDLKNAESAGDERAYAVSLTIFYETGFFYMKDVPFSETFKRGCWTWPPRVA